VVDPARKTIAVYRKDEPVRMLNEGDALTSESLLPGFCVPVAEIFR
jgi:Uma2 family endonuclease